MLGISWLVGFLEASEISELLHSLTRDELFQMMAELSVDEKR